MIRFVRQIFGSGSALLSASAAEEEAEDDERNQRCDAERGAQAGFGWCREASGGRVCG